MSTAHNPLRNDLIMHESILHCAFMRLGIYISSMKRTALAAAFFFAMPLIASAQSYYYAPNSGYGAMQQQQQQQQQGGYAQYYQPQYYAPQYYQPQYYQPQPQYYQQPPYYQPSSYYQPQYYTVGQQVPNYSSFGGSGFSYSANPSQGGYSGTPNPYLDSGYFTGNYDAFQSPICYFPSYGSADCGSDPRQPVYDVWSGTYY